MTVTMSSGRKLALRAAAAGVALLLSAVAAEVVLRVAGARLGAQVLFDRSREFYVPEEARRNPWAAGVSNALRIAVIGDSFTWGQGVQTVDRYAEHLEWLLNLNDGVRPARVSVYAECGTSTYQQRKLLRQAISNGTDLVILGICLNDTENWKDPHTVLRWRKQLRREPWGLARYSCLLTWLHDRLENIRMARAYRAYYAHLYNPEYGGWKRFESAIHDFRTACDSNGVHLVTVVFPLMDNLGARSYPFQPMHAAIAGVMRTENIDSVDILDAFLGDTGERLQAIPGVDPHPNEIAHRLIAERIFDHLLETQAIDAAYHPRGHRQMNTQELWAKEIRSLQHQ